MLQPERPARGPIERSSTSAKVAEYLRQRITDGTLKPGQRINELTLAAELGVSRSPVREALATLAGEGLVRVAPYKGTFVTPLSRERFRDLLDFRVALEQFAVRRAIERATPKELQRLAAVIDEMREHARSGNFLGAVESDLKAHEVLVSMAASPLLEQTFQQLLGEFRLYIAATIRHYEGIDELATEHAALLAAIRARRRSRAVSIIERHIVHGFAGALEELA
jgi:DNA-binding GntR family transcriptional regulator